MAFNPNAVSVFELSLFWVQKENRGNIIEITK